MIRRNELECYQVFNSGWRGVTAFQSSIQHSSSHAELCRVLFYILGFTLNYAEFYSTFQFSRRTRVIFNILVLTPNYAEFYSSFQFLRRTMQSNIQHSSSHAELCRVIFIILVLTPNYTEFYSTFQFSRRTASFFLNFSFHAEQDYFHYYS